MKKITYTSYRFELKKGCILYIRYGDDHNGNYIAFDRNGKAGGYEVIHFENNDQLAEIVKAIVEALEGNKQ